MAKLLFNGYGYIFVSGIDVLKLSFQTAIEALQRTVESAKDSARAHDEAMARGEEWIGERDEEGNVLWDQAQILEMNIEISNDAALALRKSFVIAAYHHWERCARLWTKSSRRDDHEKLAERTIEEGYPLNPKLERIRQLVNLLKHDADAWGEKLKLSWPSLLPHSFRPRPYRSWYDAVALSDEDVQEVFKVLLASGPSSQT